MNSRKNLVNRGRKASAHTSLSHRSVGLAKRVCLLVKALQLQANCSLHFLSASTLKRLTLIRPGKILIIRLWNWRINITKEEKKPRKMNWNFPSPRFEPFFSVRLFCMFLKRRRSRRGVFFACRKPRGYYFSFPSTRLWLILTWK